ncbi:site-specific integrase [Herbiconiux sp. VKM Ac-2851]|nr:site-specific integrase [Herbiconiux sp. VKM Ac-2851]
MHAEGYRDTDPAAALPKVKVPRRRARPLRAGQVDDILDSGIYKRTRDIVTIAALSGLRIGEIVRIRGQDIDHVAGTLHSVRKGGLEHTVPLHPLLLEMAAEYPRTGWWFPTPGSNKLFPNGGGHILMASASDRIGKAIRSAGITDGRLTGHSLRHFYATTLLREGVNVRTVQEMLGHASLATTQLYMEVTDEEMVAAVAKMPAITRRRASQRSAATAQRARRDRIAA